MTRSRRRVARGVLPARGPPERADDHLSFRASDGASLEGRRWLIALPYYESSNPVRIVRTTRKAKADQRPAAIMGVLAGLAATPIGAYFTAHQHASNVIVTDVIGPPVPVYILGARILDILPIVQLVGNIGLTLCAFSYAGQVFLVVTADASGFPDVDVLIAGMERDWHALIRTHIAEPARE